MQLPFPISFTKMSGTGNDFIIIDHRTQFLNGIDLADLAHTLCRRRFSIGADGLILIEESEQADFSWRFFNSDGSLAEMCGNGARCAARFAYTNRIAPAKMCFETLAGIIEAQVMEPESNGPVVKILMPPPTAAVLNQPLFVDEEEKLVHSINTGVPHAVCFVDRLQETPIFEWGRLLRYDDVFQPAGTNVNFVEILGADELKVRTYERGVEEETMACGTGAVAAALIAAMLGKSSSPTRITTSGGDQLVIHFLLENGAQPTITEVFLEGPAHIVYEGQLVSLD